MYVHHLPCRSFVITFISLCSLFLILIQISSVSGGGCFDTINISCGLDWCHVDLRWMTIWEIHFHQVLVYFMMLAGNKLHLTDSAIAVVPCVITYHFSYMYVQVCNSDLTLSVICHPLSSSINNCSDWNELIIWWMSHENFS